VGLAVGGEVETEVESAAETDFERLDLKQGVDEESLAET